MKNNDNTTTLIFLSILVLISLWLLLSGAQPWFVSSLNILFHEAGHWIFGIFGRTIGVLGGTLGELLVPSMFILYFSLKNTLPGQIFSWWWLSLALYDVSIYVADARAQALQLIGGPGGHDWFYLLGRWRLLDHDIFISKLFILASWICVAVMIVFLVRYKQLLKGRIVS